MIPNPEFDARTLFCTTRREAMKLHRISIAALVLALVGLLSVPNNAQAQQQGQANFGNLIAALNNIHSQVQALEEADIGDVQVVNVEDIEETLNENQNESLGDAFQDADLEALRNAVQNHEALTNSLSQNNVQVGDVVAVDVLNGGDVAVYVDEQGVLNSSNTP